MLAKKETQTHAHTP